MPETTVPVEFEEAAALFDAWAFDLMIKEQDERTISQPLYHYTDAHGIKGIIEEQQIRFTNHRYLNDPSEIAFGVDAAHEVIASIAANSSIHVKWFCNSLRSQLDMKLLTQTLEYFLASFSYEPNDLGQWRAYANNGRGFALGLAPRLFAVEEDKPSLKPNERIIVYPIQYGKEKARTRHRQFIEQAAAILENTLKKYEHLIRGDSIVLFIDRYVKHVLAGGTIFVCLTSKHEAYQHEREVRLMMLGHRVRFEPYIDTRVRNGELVVFVPHPMPGIREVNSIFEIVVGPAAGLDAEHAVNSLLKSEGIELQVPIRRSDIPYRA